MENKQPYLNRWMYTILLLLCSFPTGASVLKKIYLTGSTPGDENIKFSLGIPQNAAVDFIKWNLEIDPELKKFDIYLVYGESQPNTLGFKNGGQNKSYNGELNITNIDNTEIFELKCKEFQHNLFLIKINPDIFHFLTYDKKLMTGNGGWSYTLNNTNTGSELYPLPDLGTSNNFTKDSSLQVIYEGRTPCQDFAQENHLTVSSSCFKLKWKLTLYRDPKTFLPTTYNLKRTNSRENDITGKWTIKNSIGSNKNATLIILDPDKQNQAITLFAASDNVLFFLHKSQAIFKGNENFSYTLNRRE